MSNYQETSKEPVKVKCCPKCGGRNIVFATTKYICHKCHHVFEEPKMEYVEPVDNMKAAMSTLKQMPEQLLPTRLTPDRFA